MNGMLKLIAAVLAMMIVAIALPSPAQATLWEVEIENFAFNPNSLNINVGDMVEWRNRDSFSHTATSDDGVWDSGLLGFDQTYTYTFTLAGNYPYHCTLHPSMTAAISVASPTGVDDQAPSIPDKFEVSQNYPNPFNARTAIEYALPQDSHVRLVIYNLLGQNIESLVDQSQTAGIHQVIWNAADVPTGVYFYRIEAGDFTQTRKMLLAK
jgi:plastocyanin